MGALTDEQRAYFAARGLVPDKFGGFDLSDIHRSGMIYLANSGTWYAYAKMPNGVGHGYLCRAKDPILLFVQCEIMNWEPDKSAMGYDNCFAVGYTP